MTQARVITLEEDSILWAREILRLAIELKAAEYNMKTMVTRITTEETPHDLMIDIMMHNAAQRLENRLRAIRKQDPWQVWGKPHEVFIGNE